MKVAIVVALSLTLLGAYAVQTSGTKPADIRDH